MGLDTTHDCWHGGYIGFNVWRTMLAKAAGIPLGLMEGHFDWELEDEDASNALGCRATNGESLPWLWELARGAVGCVPIKWEALKPDILHVLLHHSDCDGELEAKHCLPLAHRLDELTPMMPDGRGDYPVELWRDRTRKFADGLRLAGGANESVEFR